MVMMIEIWIEDIVIELFDRDKERWSVRKDGEERIIKKMEIKEIVEICRCRRESENKFLVDNLVVIFCRSVSE